MRFPTQQAFDIVIAALKDCLDAYYSTDLAKRPIKFPALHAAMLNAESAINGIEGGR